MAMRLPLAVGALFGTAIGVIDDNAVNVAVYYETDCPYSQQFVIDEVAPVIEAADDCLSNKVRFHWYPYGMATRDEAGNMNCQHGEDECKGNRIHLCAKEKFGNTRGLTKFIICHERKIRDDKLPADDAGAVEECAKNAGHEGEGAALIECSQSANSMQLAVQAGIKTDAKKPALVPFANFRGQPELQDYNLFTGGVPDALKGALCGQIREEGKMGVPSCCDAATGRRLDQDSKMFV